MIDNEKIFRQVLWWSFVFMWFCFCKNISSDRDGEGEDREFEHPWNTREYLATEEQKKRRKDLIEKSLVTKKFGDQKGSSNKEEVIDASTDIEGGKSESDESQFNVPRSDVGSALEKKENENVDLTPAPPRKSGNFLGLSIHAISSFFDYSEHNDNNESTTSCSICLSKFEDGEEICFSPNPECSHSFHKECIVEWLMMHNECPYCRRNYLSSSDNIENKPVDEQIVSEV